MTETAENLPTLTDEWWAPDTIFNGQTRLQNWVKKYGCKRDPYRKHSPGGY